VARDAGPTREQDALCSTWKGLRSLGAAEYIVVIALWTGSAEFRRTVFKKTASLREWQGMASYELVRAPRTIYASCRLHKGRERERGSSSAAGHADLRC
jgi:hypothetical protein